MKTVGILYVLTGTAALLLAAGQAASSRQQPPQSSESVGSAVSGLSPGAAVSRPLESSGNRRRVTASPSGKPRPTARDAKTPRSAFAPATNSLVRGPISTGGAAKQQLAQPHSIENALPVRPPTVAAHAGFLPSEVPHRGPNPAVITGSAANAKGRGPAAVTGTGMERKP